MIPFGKFEPDKSIHNPSASTVILNVRPTADGWGSLPKLSVFSDALAEDPRGAQTLVTASGTVTTFVGTKTAIYRLGSDGSWTDVSHTTYALPDGDSWSFAIYGNRILATNSADGLFYYDVGSSSAFAAAAGSPPAAKYVAVVGEFVVLLNLASDPAGLQWSGIGNSEQWTSGEELSDGQTFPEGGDIRGIVPVENGAYIAQRDMWRQMTFSPGSGFTFAFTVANNARGVVAARSIVQIGQGDFVYLSRDGFFRGIQGAPIGAERVDRTFYDELDAARTKTVDGAADPFEKIAWFRYPTLDGQSRLLGYDWQLDRWFMSTQDVYSFGIFSTSDVTLEELDSIFGNNLESVTGSIDDYVGASPKFGGFDRDNKFGYFNGLSQEAMLETADIEGFPGYRGFCRGARLVGDLRSYGPGTFDGTDIIVDETDIIAEDYESAQYTMQVGVSNYHGGERTWSTINSPNQYTGEVPFRASGRLHRYRVTITDDQDWNHVIGVEPNLTREGKR